MGFFMPGCYSARYQRKNVISPMSHPFSQYIKIIGKGNKGSRSLTREEAFEAMKMVLAGDVTGEQRGAFLMLLRTREETPDEICGFLDACRLLLTPQVASLPSDLDIGCYAGKRRQLPWYLLAVACLAQAGYRIFLHGAHEPGSGRLYASQVLPALGLELAQDTVQAEQQLTAYGVTYLDLGVVLPALDAIIKLREVLGLRSCANTLGRLLNPSASPFSVQGVFHSGLDIKHARVNEAFLTTQALCYRGDGGDPEINSERSTELYLTRRGQTDCVTLPAHSEQWALKQRDMSAAPMLAVWREELQHGYASQAIQGTLTSWLMLLENLPVDEAQGRARTVWQQRRGQELPFGALSANR